MSTPFKLLAPQDVLESFYANVQRSTTIHMVMLDLDGKIVRINRALSKQFGKAPDELIGADWFDLAFPPEGRATIREVFGQVLATGLPDVYQNPITFPDGRVRTFVWSNTLTHSGDRLTGTLSFGIDISEQAETMQALKHREHQLKRSEEIAHIGTYLLDIKTGMWTSSAELDAIFGIGPEDPRTVQSWEMLIHPDDRAMMSKYFQDEVIGRHTRFDHEYRIVRASDAEVRWVHGYGDLETDAHGSLSLMIGVIQDVTDTRARATEFQNISAQYQTIFRTAPVGIARISLDTVIAEVNVMFADMLGYTTEEMVGKTIRDITVREDWDIGVPEMKRIVAGEMQSATLEKRYLRKDGSILWGRVVISIVRSPDGTPLYFLPIVRDISAEVEARDAALAATQLLQKTEERYRVATKNTGQLVYDWDIRSGRLDWEGAIQELTGYAPNEFPGATLDGWAQLIHPDDRARALATLDTAKASNAAYHATYRLRTSDGSYIDVEDHGSFLVDEKGVAIRMIGAMRDITDTLTDIAELRELLDTLPVAIGIQRDGVFLYINPAGMRLMGATHTDEVVGTSIYDRVAPEDLWLAKQRQEQFKSVQKAADRALMKMRKMDGTVYAASIDSVTIHFDRTPATLSIVQPIDAVVPTEIKDAQQQQQLADVLATMAEGFAEHEMILDGTGRPIDYRFLSVNTAFETLTGLKAKDILGKTVRTVIPTLEDIWIQRYGEVVKTGEPATFAAPSSGTGRTYSVRAWRTAPSRFATIFIDVTEASKAHQRVYDILNRSIDSFTVVRADGLCTFQSERIRSLAGYNPSDIVGKNVFSFVHPDDLATVQKEFAMGLQDPTQQVPTTYRFRKKDGSWLWIESIGTAWEEDGTHGMLISSRDVTELRLKSKESEKAKELQTMNSALIGRELRIVELKEQVRKLTTELEKQKTPKI